MEKNELGFEKTEGLTISNHKTPRGREGATGEMGGKGGEGSEKEKKSLIPTPEKKRWCYATGGKIMTYCPGKGEVKQIRQKHDGRLVYAVPYKNTS